MKPRLVGLALLGGALATVLALWLARTDHSTTTATGGALVLEGLKAQVNAVDSIRVLRGDGTTTTLRRDGSGWNVVERGYPGDTGKIRRLLLDAAALAVVEPKTSDASRHGVLGVEDVRTPSATGTQLDIAAGKRQWSVVIGKASGTRELYLRVLPGAASALAAPQLALDAAPARWLDTGLIDLRVERVRRVAARLGTAAEYVAERTAATEPNLTLASVPRGRRLAAPNAATGLAGALAGLQLDDVIGSERGAAGGTSAAAQAPAAQLRVATFDGLLLDLRGRVDGSRRYLAVSASTSADAAATVAAEAARLNARAKGREFEIAEYKYAALFRPLEDLLAPVSGSSP